MKLLDYANLGLGVLVNKLSPKPRYLQFLDPTGSTRLEPCIDYFSTNAFKDACKLHSEMYMANHWVRLPINIVSRDASNMYPLYDLIYNEKRIYRKDYKNKISEIYGLLNHPNFEMSMYEMNQHTIADLKTYGNSFWQIIRSRDKKRILQLVRLNPKTMEMVPLVDQKTGSIYMIYIQTASNSYNMEPNVFTADEIIHFKMPNIINDVEGLSDLSCLYYVINMDVRSQQFQNNFFKHGIGLGVIISVKNISDDYLSQVKSMLSERYRSNREPYTPLMIREGEMEIVSEGTKNLKDLDLRELRIAGREEILSALGVSEYIANIKMIDKQDHAVSLFRQHQVYPIQRLIHETIQMQLIQRQYQLFDVKVTNGVRLATGSKEAIEMIKLLLECTPMELNEVRELAGIRLFETGGDTLVQYTPNGLEYTQFKLNLKSNEKNTEEYLDEENPDPSLVSSDIELKVAKRKTNIIVPNNNADYIYEKTDEVRRYYDELKNIRANKNSVNRSMGMFSEDVSENIDERFKLCIAK